MPSKKNEPKKHVIISVLFHIVVLTGIVLSSDIQTQPNLSPSEPIKVTLFSADTIKQMVETTEPAPIYPQPDNGSIVSNSDAPITSTATHNTDQLKEHIEDTRALMFDDSLKDLDEYLNKVVVDNGNEKGPLELTSPNASEEWPLVGIDNTSTLAKDINDFSFDKTIEFTQEGSKQDDIMLDESYIDPLFAYQRKIAMRIQESMRIRPSFRGKECVVSINLSRDGLVLSSRVLKGASKLCFETKRALLRAGKLPMPRVNELYDKLSTLEITIAPRQESSVVAKVLSS